MTFDQSRSSPAQIREHRAYVSACRKAVLVALQEIATALQGNPSNRSKLEMLATDYRRWLLDTSDAEILMFHREIDREKMRLQAIDNVNGDRGRHCPAPGFFSTISEEANLLWQVQKYRSR